MREPDKLEDGAVDDWYRQRVTEKHRKDALLAMGGAETQLFQACVNSTDPKVTAAYAHYFIAGQVFEMFGGADYGH